ncbi:hypothetical protein QTL95_16075 [Rhizobium sp. S152]|uniref:DUF393 domain-containing protein n=1 Tax=Halobaculum lipolyticum TaxID=3032001 RepID=A0ABD5WC06_9EURY|nr:MULTISPECIES: hypothetical protein [Bacteria]MDM9627426.1 hypothetical protein [Rhizobium sp. S152]
MTSPTDNIRRLGIDLATRPFRCGWTEWYTDRDSRFLEFVAERRENPFAGYGVIGSANVVAYAVARSLVGLPGPFGAVADVFRSIPLPLYFAAASVPVVAWLLGAIWARTGDRTRGRIRYRSDAMYPPAEYWDAVRENGGDCR